MGLPSTIPFFVYETILSHVSQPRTNIFVLVGMPTRLAFAWQAREVVAIIVPVRSEESITKGGKVRKIGIVGLALGIANCVYSLLHIGGVLAGNDDRWWAGPLLILSSPSLLSRRRSRVEK